MKKTETTTSLVVQDGNTIIIGGLIRDDISKTRSGIPFLSKIPILGYLFGQTTDTDQRKELIILLTPRVIRTHADANAVTSDYVDSITKTGKGRVKKEELIKMRPAPPAPPAPAGGTGMHFGGDENSKSVPTQDAPTQSGPGKPPEEVE